VDFASRIACYLKACTPARAERHWQHCSAPFVLSLGLAGGLILGVGLNSALERILLQESASVVQLAVSKKQQAQKQGKRIAVRAAHIADNTYAYLRAATHLSIDSKTVLGQLQNVNLHQSNWTWSANDFMPDVPDQAKPETDPSIKRWVVAIDPGHGGTDPGSMAPNGLVEKTLTLDMARRVELFTRKADYGMSRQQRVDRITAVDADVVVSLHFNHLPQDDINLVETVYADRENIIESLEQQERSGEPVNLDFTAASRQLADIMHNKVISEVATDNSPVIDGGVKRDTLFMLTRSFTPGVLLELTCISNPQEAERLTSDDYRNRLAASIADGIRDYLIKENSDQFAQKLANLTEKYARPSNL